MLLFAMLMDGEICYVCWGIFYEYVYLEFLALFYL